MAWLIVLQNPCDSASAVAEEHDYSALHEESDIAVLPGESDLAALPRESNHAALPGGQVLDELHHMASGLQFKELPGAVRTKCAFPHQRATAIFTQSEATQAVIIYSP